ncbi:CCE_0567 family metalloprotein [Sinorhizobium meliloti]
MELHDLADDLPSKWTEIMAVAEKAFRAFAELDAVKRELLSRRMHNDKLIRDARRIQMDAKISIRHRRCDLHRLRSLL